MPKHSLGAGGDSSIVTNKSSYLFKKRCFSFSGGFLRFMACRFSEALGLFFLLGFKEEVH